MPAYPLFVVTGASGTGKTTIAALLRPRLPECETFDIDLILPVAALGFDAFRNTWLQLAYAISLNRRCTVLCGSLIPEHLAELPARCLLGPIHFCNLDCPDDILATRLTARPDWRGSSTEAFIAEHQHFAAWLRENIHPTFDTGVESAAEVADRVASWIRPLLPTARS